MKRISSKLLIKSNSFVFLLSMLAFQLLFSSCTKKETADIAVATPLEFVSLSANKTIAENSEEITITATAKGDNLQYIWESPTATLLGKGSQIIFIGSTCCAKENDVKCTIKDSHNNTASKTILIVIKG